LSGISIPNLEPQLGILTHHRHGDEFDFWNPAPERVADVDLD